MSQRTPWYREPWPWILISGPAVVVIAGLVTAWIAYTHGDPVLSDDYYRQGLAVQQTLASDARAQSFGLEARLRLNAAGDVHVGLSARGQARSKDFVAPSVIRVTLSHPTRAGLDQTAELHREGEGYVGRLHLPASGHWLVMVESDGADGWRMLGKVILPAAEVKIQASAP
ncbi:MAG: FixH family protein [Rhodocyclaceae bacterium]|nr:FixH family protein [Rhodocyclaceae bacterium]